MEPGTGPGTECTRSINRGCSSRSRAPHQPLQGRGHAGACWGGSGLGGKKEESQADVWQNRGGLGEHRGSWPCPGDPGPPVCEVSRPVPGQEATLLRPLCPSRTGSGSLTGQVERGWSRRESREESGAQVLARWLQGRSRPPRLSSPVQSPGPAFQPPPSYSGSPFHPRSGHSPSRRDAKGRRGAPEQRGGGWAHSR